MRTILDEGPLPVLLVLDPTMTCGPWSRAVTRAASTLQIVDVTSRDAGIDALLEYAIHRQGVERVVVCGEGRGLPRGAAAASFDAKIWAVIERVTRISRTDARAPAVDGIWFDAAAQQLFAVTTKDGWHPLVDALFRPSPLALGA